MYTNNPHIQLDPTDQILQEYHQAEREFQSHWLWKHLNVTPEKFFQAVQKYVTTLPISQDQWDRALNQARENHRTRYQESRPYKKTNSRIMTLLRI